jgi:hypothetical protein
VKRVAGNGDRRAIVDSTPPAVVGFGRAIVGVFAGKRSESRPVLGRNKPKAYCVE